MYKVKNVSVNERKFKDRNSGRWIYVGAGETIMTECIPEKNEVWKISNAEKKEKVNKTSIRSNEVKENDSSSS